MCCTIWHAWIHSKSHWHLYEAGQGVWIFFNLGCTQICTCTMLTHGQSKLNPTLHKMGSKYRLCIVKIMQMKGLLYNQCYWKCHYVKQDETKIKSKHCYNQNAPSFHTRHTELYLKIAKMEATVFLNYWPCLAMRRNVSLVFIFIVKESTSVVLAPKDKFQLLAEWQ